MDGFLKDIFKDLLTTKSLRIALQAFVVSVGVFIFVLIIFGWNYSNGNFISPVLASLAVRTSIAGAFVIFFVLVWFLIYVQVSKDADDVYSELREQLIGNWWVSYQASNGPNRNPLWTNNPGFVADIHVNPNDKKLELEFKIVGNPIYDDDSQLITAVALRHDGGNNYDMFYYYKGHRKLQHAMHEFISEDKNFSFSTGLEIEVVGILKFQRISKKEGIKEIKGDWYDLNGRATQVFALIDEALTAQRAGSKVTARPLSTAKLGKDNFAAKMGTIEFKRIQTPQS